MRFWWWCRLQCIGPDKAYGGISVWLRRGASYWGQCQRWWGCSCRGVSEWCGIMGKQLSWKLKKLKSKNREFDVCYRKWPWPVAKILDLQQKLRALPEVVSQVRIIRGIYDTWLTIMWHPQLTDWMRSKTVHVTEYVRHILILKFCHNASPYRLISGGTKYIF